MIRKHIYIDNEQDRQVKEVADTLGIAEAEVIRRAITTYMNIIGYSSITKVCCDDKNVEDQMNKLLLIRHQN